MYDHKKKRFDLLSPFSRENNCFHFCTFIPTAAFTEKLNKQQHLKLTPIIMIKKTKKKKPTRTNSILVLCVRRCRGRAVNHHQPNLRR